MLDQEIRSTDRRQSVSKAATFLCSAEHCSEEAMESTLQHSTIPVIHTQLVWSVNPVDDRIVSPGHVGHPCMKSVSDGLLPW